MADRPAPRRPQDPWEQPTASFFGREEELAELKEVITHGASAFVRGLHGIGKTSLVKKAFDATGTPARYVNFQEHDGASLDALVSELRGLPDWGRSEGCLVLDEMEADLPMEGPAPQLGRRLGLLAILMRSRSCIVIARHHLARLEAQGVFASPRLGNHEDVDVGALDENATDRLAQALFADHSFHHDDVMDAAQMVVTISGGHPRLVEMAVNIVTRLQASERTLPIISELLFDKATLYLESAWSGLDLLEQEALCEATANFLQPKAKREHKAGRHTLLELKRLGLLTRTNDPFGPLLVWWVAHLMPKQVTTWAWIQGHVEFTNKLISTASGMAKVFEAFAATTT